MLSLIELDLSGNLFSGQFSQVILSIAILNKFSDKYQSFGSLPSILRANFADNQINSLPPYMYNATTLESLTLSHNSLSSNTDFEVYTKLANLSVSLLSLQTQIF